MEKENSLPAKGRQLRVFSLVTLGLLTLSFLWLFWFYSAAIIIPYFTVVIYWVVRLAQRKILSLYDEKQKQDIAQSELATWLISIPVMIVVSVLNFGNNDSVTVVLWFPFYLFFTLLVFSVFLLMKFIKG